MKDFLIKTKETYERECANGYSNGKAFFIALLSLFGFFVGYFAVLALKGAILMWVFNLLAPLVSISLVLTFWQSVAIVIAWIVLKKIIRSILK